MRALMLRARRSGACHLTFSAMPGPSREGAYSWLFGPGWRRKKQVFVQAVSFHSWQILF